MLTARHATARQSGNGPWPVFFVLTPVMAALVPMRRTGLLWLKWSAWSFPSPVGAEGGSSPRGASRLARLIAAALHTTTEEVFRRGLLNVEEAYRAAGWKVTYDKPGFNETYPATFRFER